MVGDPGKTHGVDVDEAHGGDEGGDVNEERGEGGAADAVTESEKEYEEDDDREGGKPLDGVVWIGEPAVVHEGEGMGEEDFPEIEARDLAGEEDVLGRGEIPIGADGSDDV